MTGQGLSRAWQVWAAENLLAGHAPAVVAERLVEEGMVPAEAQRWVLELASSPALEAVAHLAADARRWNTWAAAHERAARGVMHPRAVLREDGLTADRFRELYVATRTPVHIEGVIAGAFRLEDWAPAELARRFGDQLVEVTVGRADDPHYARTFTRRSETLPLRDFVGQITTPGEAPPGDRYLVAMNKVFERTELLQLLSEIHFEPGWVDEPALRAGGASLWLGPEGTATPLHRDHVDLLVCQLHGRKRWRLIAPTERAVLDQVSANQTMLDADDIEGALVKELILEAGEALYVPAGWWHQVEASSASTTLSIEALATAHASTHVGAISAGTRVADRST